MRVFECGDWLWIDGHLPTKFNYWEINEGKTCVKAGRYMGINKKIRFGFSSKDFFLKTGVKNFISDETFYKQQSEVTQEKRDEINAYFESQN